MLTERKKEVIKDIKKLWLKSRNMDSFLNDLVFSGYTYYLSFPYFLLIYLTLRCTGDCLYCYLSKELKTKYSNELKTEEWCKILRNCNANVHKLVISGGEPTIRTDFLEILKAATNEGGFDEISILTNGTGIRSISKIKEIKKLTTHGPRIEFQITLDGATKESHELSRPGTNFESVIDFIKKAREHELSVRVVTILNRLNREHIMDICRIVRKMKLSKVHFSLVNYIGEARKNIKQIFLSQKDYLQIFKLLTRAKHIYKDLDISSDLEFLIQGNEGGHESKNTFCGIARTNMAIAPNGQILPCALAIINNSEYEENISEYDYNIENAWKYSKEFDKWRKFRFNNIPCISCAYKLCKLLCPVILMHYNCSLDFKGFKKFLNINPHYFCPIFNKSFSEVIKEIRQIYQSSKRPAVRTELRAPL